MSDPSEQDETIPLQGKLDTISLDDNPPVGISFDPSKPPEEEQIGHIGDSGALYPEQMEKVVQPLAPLPVHQESGTSGPTGDESMFPTYQQGDDPLAFIPRDENNFFFKYPIHKYSSLISSFILSTAALWFYLVFTVYIVLLVLQFFIQLLEGSQERWGLPGVLIGNIIYLFAMQCAAFALISIVVGFVSSLFSNYELVTVMGILFEFAIICFGVIMILSRLFPVFVDIIFQVGFWGSAGYTVEGSIFYLIIPGFCCCACVWPCILFGMVFIGLNIFAIVAEKQRKRAESGIF